ncbi:potassium channel family protein [Bacillus tianshenii]|nr:potassium channel family protein [Bacillus tianshenii]
MYVGMIVSVVFILAVSLKTLWKSQVEKKQYLTLENLLLLFFTYLIVLIGFGLIYALLELMGVPVLIDNLASENDSFLHLLSAKMYFSAVTLLSVGYGDITPIGAGRWIAMFEALVGYVLPAAFVVRTVIEIEKHE